jgi:hypothetical protein
MDGRPAISCVRLGGAARPTRLSKWIHARHAHIATLKSRCLAYDKVLLDLPPSTCKIIELYWTCVKDT